MYRPHHGHGHWKASQMLHRHRDKKQRQQRCRFQDAPGAKGCETVNGPIRAGGRARGWIVMSHSPFLREPLHWDSGKNASIRWF